MAIQLKISHPVKNLKVLKIAVKINSKGLMVMASSQLEVGDEVILNFDQGFKLNGKIFKFSKNHKGQEGMIIQFVDLSEENKKDLNALLNQEKKQKDLPSYKQEEPSEYETQAIVQEKTIITDLNSLEHLALQSPDQTPNFVASTLDEEFVSQASNSDLAQKTRVEMELPKIAQDRNKSRRKRFSGILIAIVAISTLIWGVQKKLSQVLKPENQAKESMPEVVSVQDVKKQKRARTKPKSKKKTKPVVRRKKPKTKKTVAQKKSISKTSLTQLDYVKTAAFYKLSISANKTLKQPSISRLNNPKRIRIDFSNTLKGKARSKIEINDRMLKNISSKQVGNTTRIEILINQRNYPRYDVKSYDRFADIFIYTLN